MFTDDDLKRLKKQTREVEELRLSNIPALLARLEAAEKCINAYREVLADMHTSPCRVDERPAKYEELDCMACWAFEQTKEYEAWRKAVGK